MKRSALLLSLMALTTLGCDDSVEGCTLPDQNPQLSPNFVAGVMGFELARLQEFNTLDAVFINGGCQALELDLASVRLEGPDAAEFDLGVVFPEDGRAAARRAVGIPVTFTSPGRGVFLTTLRFDSNAENFPTYELDLIGPGADGRIPEEPDIEFIEDPVEVAPSAALLDPLTDEPLPVAIVRFYNLGGGTLRVSDYTLADETNFTYLTGTAQPSAPCTYGGVCFPGDGPERGCCMGGLACRCKKFNLDGLTCAEVVAQEAPVPAPTCPDGQDDCDPFGLTCNAGTCEAACTNDGECGPGEICSSTGACGPRAQACASVNVTSGQFSILGIQFTEGAPSGTHSTTLEITSNDGCAPKRPNEPPVPCTPSVASVTITGTK